MAFAVDADNAGAGACQHRLGETAAAVDDVTRPHDVVALGAQFLRHAVEGFAEMGQIAFRLMNRHPHIEVAGGHDIGGADQPPDRRDQAVGEIKTDPDRRQQHGERDDRVHQCEGDLHAKTPLFDCGIFDGALPGRLQLRHDARIEQPRHVQIIIFVTAQFDDRRHVIRVRQQDDLRILVADAGKRVAWRQGEGLVVLDVGARNDVQILVEHDRRRKSPERGLEGQKLLQFRFVLLEDRFAARYVQGHENNVGAHDLRVIAQIGLRDDQRIFDGRMRACRKQPVEPAVECHAGDDRHQDRRRGGDEREQSDDAHMQARGGAPGAASVHHLPNLAHDDAEQNQHRHRIRQQQGNHHIMGGQDRRQVGENDEGDERREQREPDRDRTKGSGFRLLGRRVGERGVGGCGLIDAHLPPAGDCGAWRPLKKLACHGRLACPPRH